MVRTVLSAMAILVAAMVSLSEANAQTAQAQTAQPQTARTPTAAEQLYSELAKLPAAERQKRLEDGAKKEGKLNFIHTWRGTLARNHLRLFQKRYPFLDVEMVDIGSQDAAERLVAEETAGRHLTDIVSVSVADLNEVLAKDLSAHYPTPAGNLIYDKYKSFLDPQNRWLPFYWTEHGISYNPTMIPADKAPKDWMDLCDPVFKGQVSFDPFEVRFLAGLWNVMGEQKLDQWLTCIGQNKPIIQRGHTQRINLMIAGDHAAQGDNYLYYGIQQKLKNPSLPFEPVWTATMPATIGAMIINANTQHPYASALLVDWVLSEESQKYTAEQFRGPVAYKHPYIPEDAKIVSFSTVDDATAAKLQKMWDDDIMNQATERPTTP
ncbi:MAG TPA: ABC transporter substrate-binding protein [Alphaproteobacteria bacterium]|jgi:ABC-type Fe3+ transport system substrate-binding protein